MKKLIFTLMAASFIFVSCDSESVTNEADNQTAQDNKVAGKATAGLENLRNSALADINQGGTVYYDNQRGVTFTTSTRGSIVIPPGSISTNDGKPINGNIKIEYMEIFNRAKMVVTNKPTVANLPTGDKGFLVTGGEFYLDITYNGQQVEIVTPIKVNINTANSNANPLNMVLWNGAIDPNGDLTWHGASTQDLEFAVDGAVFGGKGGTAIYDVLIKDSGSFGWCNIDRLSTWPGTKVKLKVTPPAGFDQSNSSVYLAVEGEDNMLAQFDMFDSSTNTFEEHTGLVPVGLDCHIIFVGEQSGNYVYYILSTAISSTGTYTVPSSSLITTTSHSQVETAILALP